VAHEQVWWADDGDLAVLARGCAGRASERSGRRRLHGEAALL